MMLKAFYDISFACGLRALSEEEHDPGNQETRIILLVHCRNLVLSA